MANSSAHWRSAVLPSLKVVAAARIRVGGVPPGSTGVARHARRAGRNKLKSYEEIMEILEAFALTNSYRAAGELAGCSHHTVEHYVTMRDLGLLPDGVTPSERSKLIDGFMPKIEDWVERSKGKVRGDVVFDKLVGLGFEGSDRTTRRALAVVKSNWRAGRRRVYRPWIVEPGMWAQWDWGHGPKIAGRQTYLFC